MHRPFAPLLASLVAACAARPEAAPSGHAHAHGMGHHHRFDDPAHWATVFDAPERDAWQRPDLVLERLRLAPDARVADLGAGTGYFSVRLARAVPSGRVWAVDLEPTLLRYLRDRVAREGLGNVFPVLGTPSDPMLPEPVDLVLVVDTHHHIDHRPAYYRALRASLRPGGRVAIVDFTLDAPEGPPRHLRLSPEQVDSELREAGYARDGDALQLPRQYVLVYRAE
ncbi:MAG: class I SAM-dependent methyltransferase [Deltaproteobacteria bacterium]|nr:class I SAM-dependent methyltransferase [Deltaproteobacteria bacterium]